jgi:prevent-host-death family protein
MSQPAEKRMGVSDVRQNMTEVIAEVRLLGTPVVLTRREKPQAALVSVEFYERAIRDRAIIDELHRRTETPGVGATSYDVTKSRTIREAIHQAALTVDG